MTDGLPADPPAWGTGLRAEGLDVERLEGALAKYGIHIDINRERMHEVPCESCQAALRKVAAEYARRGDPR